MSFLFLSREKFEAAEERIAYLEAENNRLEETLHTRSGTDEVTHSLLFHYDDLVRNFIELYQTGNRAVQDQALRQLMEYRQVAHQFPIMHELRRTEMPHAEPAFASRFDGLEL